MMRVFAFTLVRLRNAAVCRLRFFRPDGAEFPAASPIPGKRERTLRGSRAAGRASIGALRPPNHWVITEDKYEISIIREKLAPWARAFPTQKRRRAVASLPLGAKGRAEERSLVKDRRFFWRREKHEKGGGSQRFGAAAGAIPSDFT
jgi:hypothetical protein